jgi:predicted RNA-binding protein with PUA-like domain
VARWLLKTEPADYSFADLERDGRTAWDGVGNALALQHARRVRAGDEAVIYHTGAERAAVGLARVVSDPYPDPAAGDPRLVVFDVVPVTRLARPVTLAELKADPAFAGCDLLRLPRLSVVPLPGPLWRRLLARGG